ncbi:hypothetical protein IGI04_042516, partial [Brassica rapa subsp. trilocularis]
KAWKVILLHFGELPTTKEPLDKEGAVWIRFPQAREAGDRLVLGIIEVSGYVCCLFFCGWVYLRFSGGNMDMKHESSGVVKIQEENKWVWPRWVKTALGSCEIWSNQVKGEPLMERAADGGQTARLKCEDQLSLEESISLEKIEDVYENKINLRRMYEVRKMICELKQGKEGFNQHVKKLRCLWSELQSLRPRSCDPRVLEEWREQDVVFSLLASWIHLMAEASSSDGREQRDNLELLQQDVDIKETINKEVKTEERWAVWSWIVTGPNGWEDFESLTRPVTCTLNGSPLPLGDSKHPSCLLLFYISHSYALHSKLGLSCTDRLVLQDVDIKETINKEVKTEERWAVWSWIVTGPNGWEDFESLTRPVTCTLNGSPLPLGDSKHPSCLLLFYISHSYALHSKLGLSCTDRLGRLRRCSKAQIRRGRCWKRSILSGYQGSYGTMKMGREEAQQILMGECSYSAYMGESVESSGVMRKLETKGADERVTKDEWDEFVKGNGTESGEQEQNQEDSGLHDQVENNVQSSGEVDEVQSSGEVDEVQSSGEEQVGPASSEDEQVEPAIKAWKVILLHFGELPTTKEPLDKEGAVWIRFPQAREAGDR